MPLSCRWHGARTEGRRVVWFCWCEGGGSVRPEGQRTEVHCPPPGHWGLQDSPAHPPQDTSGSSAQFQQLLLTVGSKGRRILPLTLRRITTKTYIYRLKGTQHPRYTRVPEERGKQVFYAKKKKIIASSCDRSPQSGASPVDSGCRRQRRQVMTRNPVAPTVSYGNRQQFRNSGVR